MQPIKLCPVEYMSAIIMNVFDHVVKVNKSTLICSNVYTNVYNWADYKQAKHAHYLIICI